MVLAGEALPVQRHTFRAMGTTVGVVTTPTADRAAFVEAIHGVESTFRAHEERFSRFLETSELSKVNARAGSWTSVSEEFSAMLSEALDGARRTSGLFDPTVLPALAAAGYDRDFNDVLAGARDALRIVAPCGRWADIEREGNMIRLPRDVALDFGGIAKGWTVDVAAELVSELLPWVLVEAGGDLRVDGEIAPPGLDIALEDPHDPAAELLRFRLVDGALATSSVTRRSWGRNLHHLIDPRTGRPARTGVVQATSWAPTCTEAGDPFDLGAACRQTDARPYRRQRSSSKTAPSSRTCRRGAPAEVEGSAWFRIDVRFVDPRRAREPGTSRTERSLPSRHARGPGFGFSGRPGEEREVARFEAAFDDGVLPDETRRFLADERHHLLLGYVDDRPAGFVSAVEVFHQDKRPELFLNEIGVVDEARRRGVARALIEELKLLGRERGCEGVGPDQRGQRGRDGLYGSTGGRCGRRAARVMFEYDLGDG